MWKTVKLSDLFKVGSSRRVLKSDWRSQGVPFYRGREITRLSLEGSVENELFITEDLYKSLATKSGVPRAGDILITAIGTIGNTYVVKNKDRFYFKDASVLWLSKTADVSSEYVQHWLRTPDFFEQLDEGNGATVDTLTIKKMASISLPLPPLAEQKRIVERLDKAFGEIDKAIATAEAKGEEAKCLVSEAIKQVFHQSPENKKKKFAEVCVLQRGFDLPKKDRSSGRHPLYSANGITDYISVSKVLGPAVITGRSGTIGEVHYSEKEIWPLNTALYVKDFKGNFPKYVYYFLRSFNLKKYASGTGVPTLNRNVLEHELVYVCEGSDRQEAKCRILDKIEEQAFKISRIQKQQLALLLQLKASILKQELTPSEAV